MIHIFMALQAGNVVTGEMVEELILSGADIIKVGIGPGGGHVSFSFLKQKKTSNKSFKAGATPNCV